MKVVFTTGRTCVGKTTLVESLNHPLFEARGGKAVVLQTSEIAKRVMSFDDMSRNVDPTAPPQADAEIASEVKKHIDKDDISLLVIDSAPRNSAQVRWIEELAMQYPFLDFEVWYCYCDSGVRNERIHKGLDRPGKREITKARIESEGPNMLRVLEDLFASKLVVRFVDLTTSWHITKTINSTTDLSAMFDRHASFNDMVLSRFNTSTSKLHEQGASSSCDPFSESAVWARRFLTAARNEIDEALDEITDEWWTVDKVDSRKLREEIIDVWHFLISAALAAGMDASEFTKEYDRKRTINVQRQASGKYSKKP